MRRYFTLDEAHALLPQVQQSLDEALAVKVSLDEAESGLRKVAEKVIFAGGVLLDRAKVADDFNNRRMLAARLKGIVEGIQAHGCVVKDLDVGLLDFPTLLRGEEVYLCWKAGEPEIRFWHGVSEGYRGRKEIDDDFRANHAGGTAQDPE